MWYQWMLWINHIQSINCHNHVKCFSNKCCFNTILILIYVLMYAHNKYPRCYNSVTPHELTLMSAGQWPTQKPYKNHFLFWKECGQPYDFCREANNVGRVVCVCIIHDRAIIFCTNNHIILVANNININFN